MEDLAYCLSGPSLSYHPQGLPPLHTPGVMAPMKMVQKWRVTRPCQCFSYSFFSWSYTLLWSVYGNWDAEGCTAMGWQVHFTARTALKTLNKGKGWCKKVILTTPPPAEVQRMHFIVTHHKGSKWVKVSEDVNMALTDGSSEWKEKLLWLWQDITFLLPACCPQFFFFFNLPIASEKIILYDSLIFFKFHYWAARETRTLLPCCAQLVKNERWHGVVCFAAFFCPP